MISSSRKPRPIGKTRPSSRAPPSRKTAKIIAADDQQQRLGEDDDADDEQREAEPDRCPLQLADDHRDRGIRLGRAARRAARSSAALPCPSPCGPAASVPARPERSASNQLSGLSSSVVPSSEKVMNSARPPIFSHGTGPPRPFSGGPRRSGCRRCGRGCRPSGTDGRPGPSPARNRRPGSGRGRSCRRSRRWEGSRGRSAGGNRRLPSG